MQCRAQSCHVMSCNCKSFGGPPTLFQTLDLRSWNLGAGTLGLPQGFLGRTLWIFGHTWAILEGRNAIFRLSRESLGGTWVNLGLKSCKSENVISGKVLCVCLSMCLQALKWFGWKLFMLHKCYEFVWACAWRYGSSRNEICWFYIGCIRLLFFQSGPWEGLRRTSEAMWLAPGRGYGECTSPLVFMAQEN